MSVDTFEFTTAPPHTVVAVTIDASTQGKQELLTRFAQGLSFPDYFGRNWDALIDCLSDLTWCSASELIVDHGSLPQLSEIDLKLYLRSLAAAAARRTAEMRPRLRLVFREKDRETITSILGQ